jgi:hypothetical protein
MASIPFGFVGVLPIASRPPRPCILARHTSYRATQVQPLPVYGQPCMQPPISGPRAPRPIKATQCKCDYFNCFDYFSVVFVESGLISTRSHRHHWRRPVPRSPLIVSPCDGVPSRKGGGTGDHGFGNCLFCKRPPNTLYLVQLHINNSRPRRGKDGPLQNPALGGRGKNCCIQAVSPTKMAHNILICSYQQKDATKITIKLCGLRQDSSPTMPFGGRLFICVIIVVFNCHALSAYFLARRLATHFSVCSQKCKSGTKQAMKRQYFSAGQRCVFLVGAPCSESRDSSAPHPSFKEI